MQRAVTALACASLWLAIGLMPFAAHSGGLAITPVMFTMGVIGLLVALMRADTDWKSIALWLGPLLAFLIWANITSLWSPFDPGSGLTNGIKALIIAVTLGFAPFVLKVVSQDHKILMQHLFMATSVMAAGLLCFDVMSGWGLSILVDPIAADENLGRRQNDALMNVGHGIYIYGQYAAPFIALCLLRLKRGLAWPLILIFLGLLGLAGHLNKLQITSVLISSVSLVMLAAFWKPKWVVLATLIASTLSILLAPGLGVFSDVLLAADQDASWPESWRHRLRMWSYCLAEIKQNPFIGQGIDAARTYQETYQTNAGYDAAIVSLHPHNIGVHIWLETGLIGAILVVLTVFGLINPAMAYANTPLKAAALSGVILTTLLLSATTVSLWHEYWWASSVFAFVILGLFSSNIAGKPHLRPALDLQN